MKKILALCLLASTASFADTWANVGTIKEIRVDADDNRIKIIGTANPGCADTYLWWNRTREQSKDWLALALSAYTSGKKIEGWVGTSCEINKLAINEP